jgi:hypothetical protein
MRGVALEASGTVLVPSFDASLLCPHHNGGVPISKSGAFQLAENQKSKKVQSIP